MNTYTNNCNLGYPGIGSYVHGAYQRSFSSSLCMHCNINLRSLHCATVISWRLHAAREHWKHAIYSALLQSTHGMLFCSSDYLALMATTCNMYDILYSQCRRCRVSRNNRCKLTRGKVYWVHPTQKNLHVKFKIKLYAAERLSVIVV